MKSNEKEDEQKDAERQKYKERAGETPVSSLFEFPRYLELRQTEAGGVENLIIVSGISDKAQTM